ncbi:hypothetical protein VTN02DRAFT_3963 [Thermoascus thermophilus]
MPLIGIEIYRKKFMWTYLLAGRPDAYAPAVAPPVSSVGSPLTPPPPDTPSVEALLALVDPPAPESASAAAPGPSSAPAEPSGEVVPGTGLPCQTCLRRMREEPELYTPFVR